MTKIVKLGAPSLTGKDANQLVAEAFADAKYPLTVTVKNHMPRDVVFPEVPGLFLKHVAHATESVKTVKVASHDLFQRVASSIEQIAELNRYKLAVTISDGAIPTEAEGDDAGGEGSGTGTGTGGEGDETIVKKPSEGLSYDQLKDALKAKGIDFQANAKKADLAALLDAAPAAVESDEKPAGDAGGEGSGSAGDANGSADGQAGGE
ncbi:hypothetical protein [Pandoraea apista]|uniref:hypothetical protein n=1 Tax=Pandoraea apista TaxID=93218 RepID=UPI00058A9C37|nr:hypothetical protein [Pandoraea apista]AJE99635.1 hypothetical protein SG18_18105 [Pandoraea apista]AKH73757.1 hypothetical protein XM39_18295 [Pandoraea apista]AKI62305.1 hypothetical protein AA956_11610 [Pandoraea apista]